MGVTFLHRHCSNTHPAGAAAWRRRVHLRRCALPRLGAW